MTVILPIQETEIRRIEVQSHPAQLVQEILLNRKITLKAGYKEIAN
jgi:hypothetical protein